MARAFGEVEDYQEDQLVVALPDLGIVTKILTDLHADITKEEDPQLGLALLSLGDGGAKKAADELREDRYLVDGATNRKWPRGAPPAQTEPANLDLLLYTLREKCAADFGGWVPEIGKNRMIAPVRGFPYVSGCTAGDPRLLGFDDPNPNPGPDPAPGPYSEFGGSEPPGWKTRPTEPGQFARVGLLDTELYQHPWLAGGYLATDDALLKPPKPGEHHWATAGHGTFIAGLILHQAPGAALIVRRAMGENARGKTWDVAKAMARFADMDVDILNLSFGCYTDDGEPPLLLAKAVSLLSAHTLLVAAAGNHGNIDDLKKEGSPLAKASWMANVTDKTPVWPAAFPEVTAVGATREKEVLADFTPKVPWIDVVAPGVNVQSTYLAETVCLTDPTSKKDTGDFRGRASWDGTSFAAGIVSGAVAAKIESGRNAREALKTALKESTGGIQEFDKIELKPYAPPAD
jgi:subtilase family protein